MTAEIDKWECQLCGINNSNDDNECGICGLNRDHIDTDNEYDTKLSNFKERDLANFIKLDNFDTNKNLFFESVMHCYSRRFSLNIDICDWYRQYFPSRKNYLTMKKVVNKYGYKPSTNQLDRYYNEEIKLENDKFKSMFVNRDILSILSVEQEVVNFQELNKVNNFTEHWLNKVATDEEIWQFIIGNNSFTDMDIRKIITEFDFDSMKSFEMLMHYLNDNELGEYLKDSCVNGNVKLVHLRQAIRDDNSISSALVILKKNCDICLDDFPMEEIVTLMTCSHSFCKGCAFSWLKEAIISQSPCKWSCPHCGENSLKTIDTIMYYNQLKSILSGNKDLENLFDHKLLQQELMKSEKFHWCANEQCTNGFEADAANKVQCPLCKVFMCVNCNRLWQNSHEDKTCQEFELWMLKNDHNLSNLLKDIGIECPDCGTRYALAAGGCLHFDCRQCNTKFCGGCKELFVDRCLKNGCEMTNFHSHHPRNCLYFLRDSSANDLEKMLKNSDYPKLQGKTLKICEFIITDDRLNNIKCGKDVHFSTGLCEGHYKEYLVQFINQYKIDPADFADPVALNMMLFQMALPKLEKLQNENDEQFKARLTKQVKDKCLFYNPK